MSELVSILIPAYNAQPWLAAAIDSALAQTWPHKEVIVVDDGSTDATFEIASRFASRGVRVISQANKGASAARNAAVRAARGSYLQFLDADDLLHPDKLALQLRQAEDGHRSRTLLTCAWGRFLAQRSRAVFAADALWQDLSSVDWMVAKFTENKFMCPASWLVSRCLADAAGPWDENLTLDDDGEYMCRLVAASRRVHFVRQARCYYRVGNPASLSARKSAQAMQSQFLSLRLCIGHLLSLEDSPRTRVAAIKLLQDNLRQFHPEQRALAEQCRTLARLLGGELAVPHEHAHFRLFRSLFGWQRAKQLRGRLNEAKLRVRRTIERLPHFGAHAN